MEVVRRPGAAARILRQARGAAGLSQRELAALADVPQPSIARIESGASQPTLETLLLLCNAAGHDLELDRRRGEGVDRTMIRASLDTSPADRAATLRSGARAVSRLRSAVRR